jgi:hypothetical protein
MHFSPRFVCIITSVILGACTCFGLLAIYNHANYRTNQTIFILNIVAVSILLTLIISIILYQTFRTIRGRRTPESNSRSAILEVSQFSSKTSAPNVRDDACSICLNSLSLESVRNMHCCSNQIHEPCIVAYCSSHISSYSSAPQCPLCRSIIPVTWTPTTS